ncbi:anaerobic ribonucleoside-triphosphate reductase activating protein [Parablautia sp. Marseille-Q6255]|uniref:anaerobic ribonucleoside-triphosphate reductase activating protein n=1 Tax=Parablautia sp. Marseille-Q6255 TaxID=3039593 RepID=UPI0024BBF36D|nr:anaerobic ribonucleoside-triphosphate reductase activating protein [Parablautia sp. Marseille-Q6255]
MRYHNITKDDMLNGDGLRVVLWVSGCSHRCPECQNPVTWDPDGGILFEEKDKEELFAQLSKPYVSGVTFSGGDPLFESNEADILALAKEIRMKFPRKTIWLYTGYLWEYVKTREIVHYLDVLVDGPYVKQLRDTKLYWRGSANQRVIDVKESLTAGKVVLHCE